MKRDAVMPKTPIEAEKWGKTDVAQCCWCDINFIADAVLLDAGPLENITSTRRVRGVLHLGKFRDRPDLH